MAVRGFAGGGFEEGVVGEKECAREAPVGREGEEGEKRTCYGMFRRSSSFIVAA